MMNRINVVSMFDGGSGGMAALDRIGIKCNYFAFEIDKYAIQVSQKNYPNIFHLGDAKEWRENNLPPIDLFMAGFPCQSYSIAGKRKGIEDPRGKLMHTMLDFIEYNRPKKLFLENVKGFLSSAKGKDFEFLMSSLKDMGYDMRYKVANASLVSAQSRDRVYFTNWDWELPKDRGITLSSILEDGYVDWDKSYCIDANYWKGGNFKSYFGKGRRQLVFDQPVQVGIAELNGHDIIKRVYSRDAKSPTVSAHAGGNQEPKVDVDRKKWRKLTPTECEKLQGMEVGHTDTVSNTQRYKIIGNGFNIDMVAHILTYM